MGILSLFEDLSSLVKIIWQLGSIHYLHTNSVAGGSGQRRMTLISTDTEGYSGQQIQSFSNWDKNLLFLVPRQEEMDTQTLPYNSAEFAKMPKVPCVTCNTTMPLQMLALHTEECKQNSNVSCVYIHLLQLWVLYSHTGTAAKYSYLHVRIQSVWIKDNHLNKIVCVTCQIHVHTKDNNCD